MSDSSEKSDEVYEPDASDINAIVGYGLLIFLGLIIGYVLAS